VRQVILDKASLTVHEGDRIGLVGKTVQENLLSKIISGLMPQDSGKVTKKKI